MIHERGKIMTLDRISEYQATSSCVLSYNVLINAVACYVLHNTKVEISYPSSTP